MSPSEKVLARRARCHEYCHKMARRYQTGKSKLLNLALSGSGCLPQTFIMEVFNSHLGSEVNLAAVIIWICLHIGFVTLFEC